MDVRDKILDLIRIKGPVIPSQISKEINSNIILASAYLSELADHKKLKISKLKIGGGSPLYFLPGQEPRLQDFSKHLSEKDRRAFEYLREHKILRDSDLSPLMRVSLREIKDFARPLEVMFNKNKEIFWKWYTLDTNECNGMIKKMLVGDNEEIAGSGQVDKPEEQIKGEVNEARKQESQSQGPQGVQKPKESSNSFNDIIDSGEVQEDNDVHSDESNEDVVEESGESTGNESDDDFEEEDYNSDTDNAAADTDDNNADIVKDINKREIRKDGGRQQTLVKKAKAKADAAEYSGCDGDYTAAEESPDYVGIWDDADSDFIRKLKDYFRAKNISLADVKINRKDSDIEFTLNIESSIGKILYFCKAKNKKKINEGDLSSAYMLGQASKLPTALIITGDMTKKAKEMLETQLKGLVIVRI